MRKSILIFVATLGFAYAFSTSCFAEEMQGMNNRDMGQGRSGQGMMKGGPGQGKMNPMMMGMMHKDSVVATSDGGVVVLSGPRLLKYDASLTLVNEIELPRGKKQAPPQEESEAPKAEEDNVPRSEYNE